MKYFMEEVCIYSNSHIEKKEHYDEYTKLKEHYLETKQELKKDFDATLSVLKKKQYNITVNNAKNIITVNGVMYFYEIRKGIWFICNVNKKDASENQYAINLLLNAIERNHIIIAIDTGFIRNNQYTKKYGIIHSRNIANIGNINGYEVIANLPDSINNNISYKFYLDVDIVIEKDKHLNNKIKLLNDIGVEITNAVIDKLKTTLNYDVNRQNIYFLSSFGDIDDTRYKYSVHIIFSIFVNDISHMNILFTYLNATIFNLKKYENYNIDPNVYKKVQNFRLFGNSKLNTERTLKPLKLSNFGYSENIRDYMIMSYSKTDYINITKISSLINEKLKKTGLKSIELLTQNEKLQIINDVGNVDANSNVDIQAIFSKYSNKYEAYIEAYLFTIYNKSDKPLLKFVWDKIMICLCNIGINHFNDKDKFKELFIAFTLQAYNIDREQHEVNARRIWDDLRLGNDKSIGLITLRAYATLYNKEVHFTCIKWENIKYQYNIDTSKYDEVLITDTDFNIDKLNMKNKWVIVKLNTGEGKTKETFKLSLKYDKTIILSNRRFFANDMYSKLSKFYRNHSNKKDVLLYLDDKDEVKKVKIIKNENNVFETFIEDGDTYTNINDYSAFIISPQSLHKFAKSIIATSKKLKTLLFIDESEAIYDCLLCDETNKHQLENYKSFCELCNYCNTNIFTDAFYSNKSDKLLNEVKTLSKDKSKVMYIHANNRAKYVKKFYNRFNCTSQNRELIFKNIAMSVKKQLEEGKKVYIFCEYKNFVRELEDFLIRENIDKNKIYALSSDIHDNANMTERERLMYYINNPDEFKNIDVVIHTTCILNGFSIELKGHFDICIAILSNHGISANDTLNALGRGRDIVHFEYYFISIYKKGHLLKTNPIDYETCCELVKNNKESRININYNDYDGLIDVVNIHKELYDIINVKKYKPFIIKSSCITDTVDFRDDDGIIYFTCTYQIYNNYINTIECNQSKNVFVSSLAKLNALNMQFRNINMIDKLDLFEYLITANGNHLDKTSLSFETQLKTDKSKLSDKKIIQQITTEQYGVVPDTYGIVREYKTIEDTSDRKTNDDFIAKKIDYNFSDEYLSKDDIYNASIKLSYIKSLVDNLVLYKRCIINNETNSLKYMVDLLKILNTNIKEIKDYSIDTLYIRNCNLYDKISTLATEHRKYNKKVLRSSEAKGKYDNTINNFVRDINEIFGDFMIKLDKERDEKGKPIKKYKKIDGKNIEIFKYIVEPARELKILCYENKNSPIEVRIMQIIQSLILDRQHYDFIDEN